MPERIHAEGRKWRVSLTTQKESIRVLNWGGWNKKQKSLMTDVKKDKVRQTLDRDSANERGYLEHAEQLYSRIMHPTAIDIIPVT